MPAEFIGTTTAKLEKGKTYKLYRIENHTGYSKDSTSEETFLKTDSGEKIKVDLKDIKTKETF